MLFYQLERKFNETYLPRRIFTEEFKKEAVRLVQTEGLTLAEVGRNLDVAPKSLKTWIVLHQQGTLTSSLGVAKPSADQLRIRELERELAIAREERDILKKATVYSMGQRNTYT